MPEQYGQFDDFSGGLSDSDVKGVRGSFADAVGMDIHSEPGVLKVNQALKQGTLTIDFPRFGFKASDGSTYWFGDTGQIYIRTSGGSYSQAYKLLDAIVGANEFDGFIYFASTTALHRKTFPGASDWSDVTTDWQSLNTADWHDMVKQGLYLFVGNNTTIATVDDSGTFTATGNPNVALTALPHQLEITSMDFFGLDVIAGTKSGDTDIEAHVVRWDNSSPTFIADADVQEKGVNVLISYDDNIFVQAGGWGNIYFYDGEKLTLRKNIKGTYENKTMKVNPGSRTTFRKLALFGVSNDSGNPCKQGIYSLGRHDNNYSLAVNLEYVISQDTTSALEMGGLEVSGNNLLAGWKQGSTYGIDEIDWDTKYSGASYKTLAFGSGNRALSKKFQNYVIAYQSKPSGTDIGVNYYLNYGNTTAQLTSTYNDSDNFKIKVQNTLSGTVLQLETTVTVSGNNAPEITAVYADWDNKGII